MAMPVGTSARPPPARDGGVDAGVEVEPGVARVGVGGQREVRIEPDDRHRQRHRPSLRVGLRPDLGGPSGVIGRDRCGSETDRAQSERSGGRNLAGDGAPAVGRRPRPLAGGDGPAAPAARRRRPAGDRRRCGRRGAGARRGAPAHVADAGRQRHRRAAAHQPRPGAARPPPGRPGAVARARPGHRRARLAPASRRPAATPGSAAPRRR